jgi:hypothetical protein
MKFWNPETEELLSVSDMMDNWCGEVCKGKKCPINDLASKSEMSGRECAGWISNHPHEAARLMGFEVVEDDCVEPRKHEEANAVEGLCCDCAHGGPCCDWSENEDCQHKKEGGTCWVPYTVEDSKGAEIDPVKKEADMDKPRICEVLGVEVGEDFKYRHPDGTEENICVCEDGRVIISSLSCKMSTVAVLINAINYPDRIIRKPRFTQQEVEDAKNIIHTFGRKDTFRRTGDGVLCFGDIVINSSLLPSIKPGQSVTLDEIINSANGQ